MSFFQFFSKLFLEFEKQSAMMDMKEEMMNDVMDDAMGDEDDEEESEAVVNKALVDFFRIQFFEAKTLYNRANTTFELFSLTIH